MSALSAIRPLLEPWGDLKSQAPTEWTGEIPLPESLRDFYREVGPVGLHIDAGGNPVYIPPLNELWEAQAGYRWSGHTGERLVDWNAQWLVVAEQGGDPFILDAETGHVLFAFHGAGGWAPEYFAPNMTTAAGAIATVANALRDLGDDAFDDTYELKSSARDGVRKALAAFLGGNIQKAEESLHAWRWYE